MIKTKDYISEKDFKEGSYRIGLELIDSNNQSIETSFKAKFTRSSRPTINLTKRYDKAPEPFIKFFNNYGLMRIGFTRPIRIPNFYLYPEFIG